MFSLIGVSSRCACKCARRNREADGRKDGEGRTERVLADLCCKELEKWKAGF